MIIDQYFQHIHTRGSWAQVHLLKLAIFLLASVCLGIFFSSDWLHYLSLATGPILLVYPFGLGCRSMMKKFAATLDGCGDAYKTKVLLTTMNAFNFVMGLLFLIFFNTHSLGIKAIFFVLFLIILATTIFSLSLTQKIRECHISYSLVTTLSAILIEFLMLLSTSFLQLAFFRGSFSLWHIAEHYLVIGFHILAFFWCLDDLIAILTGNLVVGPLRFRERRDSIELEETVHGPCELLDVVALQERFQAYQRPTLM
ncbi:hypothetical protein CAEBREN_18807 [Caenorhabditis brenneri]|uniref:Uncharacterized protein n=1 Tax=Caenorhabditis brenneri TaxID=135651 RepID=G0N801_CAEBE|nr:hypothetical protein CAEBREN_18807 [Caenorhabditis brenneri]